MLPKITLFAISDTCAPGLMRKFTEQNTVQPLKLGFLVYENVSYEVMH